VVYSELIQAWLNEFALRTLDRGMMLNITDVINKNYQKPCSHDRMYMYKDAEKQISITKNRLEVMSGYGEDALNAISYAIWNIDPAILISLNYFSAIQERLASNTKSTERITSSELNKSPLKNVKGKAWLVKPRVRAMLRFLVTLEIREMEAMLDGQTLDATTGQFEFETEDMWFQDFTEGDTSWFPWFEKNLKERKQELTVFGKIGKEKQQSSLSHKAIQFDHFYLTILICRVLPKLGINFNLGLYKPKKGKTEYLDLFGMIKCNNLVGIGPTQHITQTISIAEITKGHFRGVKPEGCIVDGTTFIFSMHVYKTLEAVMQLESLKMSKEDILPANTKLRLPNKEKFYARLRTPTDPTKELEEIARKDALSTKELLVEARDDIDGAPNLVQGQVGIEKTKSKRKNTKEQVVDLIDTPEKDNCVEKEVDDQSVSSQMSKKRTKKG
jgi:hypothetical protein